MSTFPWAHYRDTHDDDGNPIPKIWWNPLDKEARRAAFLVCHSLGLCWVRFW